MCNNLSAPMFSTPDCLASQLQIVVVIMYVFKSNKPPFDRWLISIDLRDRGARWPSGSVSDSGARSRGFDYYLRRVVFLSKDTCTPRKVLVIHRNRRPDMTEKMLTGTLSMNTNKQFCSPHQPHSVIEIW